MSVVVTLRFEGVHSWPGCPHDDVAFLRHPHRHVFHITAKKPVTHDDRDVEIIRLKRAMEAHLTGYAMEQGSCEMLARHLAAVFGLSYCMVLEDGENGAELIA